MVLRQMQWCIFMMVETQLLRLKLRLAEIEKGPPNLNKFEDSPEKAGMRKPRFIMILRVTI